MASAPDPARFRTNVMNLRAIRWLFLAAGIHVAVLAYADTPAAPSAVESTAAYAGCSAADVQGKPGVRVKDIVGMYRQSVEGLPAHAWPSDDKLTGYNYLAITSVGGNRLRVRLVAIEINLHDCGFDSQALLCGRDIRLVPNEEEKSGLDETRQPIPILRVTKGYIGFVSNPDGTFVTGDPYCGGFAVLHQVFKRNTRNSKIDNSVFDQ